MNLYPFNWFLIQVSKTEKTKNIVDWNFLNNFFDKFDYEKLSTSSESITVQIKDRGKEIELVSDKEKWFGGKTKVLF